MSLSIISVRRDRVTGLVFDLSLVQNFITYCFESSDHSFSKFDTKMFFNSLQITFFADFPFVGFNNAIYYWRSPEKLFHAIQRGTFNVKSTHFQSFLYNTILYNLFIRLHYVRRENFIIKFLYRFWKCFPLFLLIEVIVRNWFDCRKMKISRKFFMLFQVVFKKKILIISWSQRSLAWLFIVFIVLILYLFIFDWILFE